MAYKVCKLAWSKDEHVYRSIKDTWARVDGRVSPKSRDTRDRYNAGPVWWKNSCAIDVVIFCGLRLDAGRIEADQIRFGDMEQLPPPAKKFRDIMLEHWGTVDSKKRSQLRDDLRRSLVREVKHFGGMTAAHPIETVVLECFRDLPQSTYTDVPAFMCCDEKPWVVSRDFHYQKRSFFEIGEHTLTSGGTIQGVLKNHFARCDATVVSSSPACSNGVTCSRRHEKVITVIDRMPPVLVVGLPGHFTPSREKKHRALTELHFDVQILHSRERVEYVPIGCIVYDPSMSPGHFTARWKAERHDDEGDLSYDGMKNEGRAGVVDKWYDIAARGRKGRRKVKDADEGPIIVFYRLKSTMQAMQAL